MNVSKATHESKPSATARAEAAAWLARLHGPNRTPEVEAGFRQWMADDPERAAAFEYLTDTWEKSARLRRRPIEQVASWERVGFRMRFSRAAFVTAVVAALAVIGTLFYLRNDAVTTGIGEQRTLTLEDGSRVYLNTATRAVVHYDERVRRVELERGEALFEVARRSDRPFIVTAGDRQIRALGTAFVVRRDEQVLAVILVEGKVTVAPLQIDNTPTPLQETRVLTPGERLTFTSGGSPRLDRPPIERMTAWKRGQVVLDSTPLADAVAEMNRYSTVRLVIEDPRAATIRISGVFRAGDSVDFAQAVARTYRLKVVDRRREIVLAGEPSAPMASDGEAQRDR